MRPILLIDFGSTFTKLTAVDLDQAAVLATAQDFTTASTDISIGLNKALERLAEHTGDLRYEARLACSSAAGGLRMVACGLVPELTAKAARFAAFGAGAKVIKTFSFQLTQEDCQEIQAIAPDILLLVGGTDGGNSEVVLHNARAIAGIPGDFPVVYAGNRAAKADCVAALEQSAHPVYTAPNVMPTFGKVDEQPVQQVIRNIFLQRIVHGKGLSQFEEVLDGILMPTPAAVLTALTLLSKGAEGQRGLGDLVAIDLGGATTDVYSIASGEPTQAGTFLTGLREPHVKRTVEGDIGMRYSAHGVLAASGADEIARLAHLQPDKVPSLIDQLVDAPSRLPETAEEKGLDYALAALSIRTGLIRHAGSVQQIYTPVGPMFQQVGKDLREVELMILTGGALIYADDADGIAREAVAVDDPTTLIPRRFRAMKDSRYILSAMGLLAGHEQKIALQMLKQHFGKGE